MTCRYCGTVNAPGEVRCTKCESRLAARPRPARAPSAGSAALAPRREVAEFAPPSAHPPETAPASAPYQASLFAYRDSPRVVPIRPPDASRRARQPRPPQSVPAPRYQQQDLAFPALAGPVSVGHRRRQEGVLCCDAPVASNVHRLLAVAADLALVMIAAGLLALIYHAGGGAAPPSTAMPLFYGGVVALVWLFYECLWAIAGGDTPGMEWARLRLISFDGHRPACRQRLLRLAVTVLGLLAAGLGILWALFDEEKLTWQDHVSNTFPAPQ